MDIINDLFLSFFAYAYPFLHNHFVTYLMFLIILLGLTYGNWKLIEKNKGSKGSAEGLMKIILILAELLFVSYLIWFVFVHFQTYKVLPNTCFQTHSQLELGDHAE